MTTIPTDELFAQQWYLRNVNIGQYDINVTTVWDEFTGRGIRVMVIDDGFDYLHPDLVANYDQTADYDFTNEDDDAAPGPSKYADPHGTPVMSLIGAALDGSGMVGVAHEATLTGARISYASGVSIFLKQWIAALDAATGDGTDVVNMSFDYNSNTNADLQIGEHYIGEALQRSVANGRDGLGLVLVRSAGNLDPWSEYYPSAGTNGNQLNAHSTQITVGAVAADGFVPDYSSEGTHLLVAAIGSSIPGSMVAADKSGTSGGYEGDYMPDFNATSAAAALVSGVAALMLEANANLGWRDVQTILAYSARHVGSIIDGTTTSEYEANPWLWNSATNWNGGGLHFNTAYGYGLVDALAAVRLAESWTTVSTSANERHLALDLLPEKTGLADPTGERLFTAEVKQAVAVERVVVSFDAITLQGVTVEISLISPDGQEISLTHIPNTMQYYGSVSYHSQALRGQLAAGEWQVRIEAPHAGAEDLLRDVRVDIYGSKATKDDSYVYTNEFSDFAGDGHAADLSDTNGGRDLLNASAVTSAMIVDLGAGTGTIDGVEMAIKGIEDVFGGDGADTLTGSKVANDLAGGRGSDRLIGGKGNDDFIFRHVNDSRIDAADVITDFGKGKDHIDLTRIDANDLTEADNKFRFIGKAEFSETSGELRYFKSAGKTYVEGDVDGDGLADFMITLNGKHDLVKGEFIL